jgi:hypothetical protein
MTSLVWPNLTMMDITRARDQYGKRPLEWMTTAKYSIDKMRRVHHIIIADDIHPNPRNTNTNNAISRGTSTFIGKIASISHVMQLHISQLYSHNGEAVRARHYHSHFQVSIRLVMIQSALHSIEIGSRCKVLFSYSTFI